MMSGYDLPSTATCIPKSRITDRSWSGVATRDDRRELVGALVQQLAEGEQHTRTSGQRRLPPSPVCFRVRRSTSPDESTWVRQ